MPVLKENPLEEHYENLVAGRPWSVLKHLFRDEQDAGPIHVIRQCDIGIYGRPDLVLVHRFGATVVELKRKSIEQGDVGQLLRYMGLVTWALHTEERLSQHHILIDGVLVAPFIKYQARWASHFEHAHILTSCPEASAFRGHGVYLPMPINFYEIDELGNTNSARGTICQIGTDPGTADFRNAVTDAAGEVWGHLVAGQAGMDA